MADESILRPPFDPGEPFDAMADGFRLQVLEMALQARHTTIFRDMNHEQQLSCLICGVLTGLLGVGFAFVQPSSRDAVQDIVRNYVASAAENVMAMQPPFDGPQTDANEGGAQ